MTDSTSSVHLLLPFHLSPLSLPRRKPPLEGGEGDGTKNHREVAAGRRRKRARTGVHLRGEKARRERREGERGRGGGEGREKEMGRPYTHPGTIIPVVMETPPRRPYVSPPPHPTNTTRPLPPLARCLFYHPPAPLLEPPFRESTRNSYRSADEFEVLRILRGVLLTTGSSLSLSLPLLFIFLFFPRFFTSLLLPPSVSTPPRGFSPFYPSSSSLFREREE